MISEVAKMFVEKLHDCFEWASVKKVVIQKVKKKMYVYFMRIL
jgi:hypothetical protein